MGILDIIAGCAGAFAGGVVRGVNGACPKCGRVMDGKSLFCQSCGTKLPNRCICEKCGTLIKDSNFCPQCGQKASDGETVKEQKVTGILKEANDLYRQGECAEAVRMLEKAHSKDDLLKIFQLISAGDYKTAVDNFNLTEIIIPNGVQTIKENAFRNCTSLVNVYLSDSVKSIRDSAFAGCTNLKNIRIPNGIETIASSAFLKCANLVYNRHDTANYLGNEENPYLFLARAKSKDIYGCAIHDDTRIIGGYAFQDCENIFEIILPPRVTNIEDGAFENCVILTILTIHNHLKYIGESVFLGCDNLQELNYTGSDFEWNNIIISWDGNYMLDNVSITYNYSASK